MSCDNDQSFDLSPDLHGGSRGENKTVLLAVCPLIAVILALLAGGIFTCSAVHSEGAHLASGISHWRYGDFSDYNVNPPLVRYVCTLPVYLFFGDRYPWPESPGYSEKRREWGLGADYIRENSPDIIARFRTARLTSLLFSAAGLLACAAMAYRYYGITASVMALLLWGCSPYFLGHAATIMPDAHAASMAVVALFFFQKYLRSPNAYSAFVAGVTLGLAELAKFTLLVFYPLYLFLWIIYNIPVRARRLGHLFLLLAVSAAVINACYQFEGTFTPLRQYSFVSALFSGGQDNVPVVGGNRFRTGGAIDRFLGRLPMPLPKNFVRGIDTQRRDFETGLSSYLRGVWSEHGWWYYYLYALLLKIPLGALLLFVLAVLCTLFRRDISAPWRDELTVLLPGVVLLIFVSSQTGFSVHSRYAIPAIPFFCIWTSKIARLFTAKSRPRSPARGLRALVIFLVLWSAASALRIYPHSIAYFNELAALIPTPASPEIPAQEKSSALVRLLNAGPRHGLRHLSDSNIDWGQEDLNLLRWYRRQNGIDKLGVCSNGSIPPGQLGFPLKSVPFDTPAPGWYAVGSDFLCREDGSFRYFRQFTPVTVIGQTMYVYHLTQEEIDARKSSGTIREFPR